MNFPPELIGVGKYTGELADWLGSRGPIVEVVTAQPHYPGFAARSKQHARYTRAREGGVGVTRCPLVLRNGGQGIWRLVAPLSFALSSAPVLLWRALRFRPAVVLCVEPTLLAAPIAILAARLVGARLALHVQDLEVDAAFMTGHLRGGALRRLATRAESYLLRRFDAVITISNAMAARLRAKGVAARRLAVLRNWTQPDRGAASAYGVALRAELGIGSEEPMVLYAGHLGVKQGVPVLLDALYHLCRKHPVRIVIAGEGPMAPLVEAARSFLPNLAVLPLQSKERYAGLLAAADVHVLPQDPRAADLVFPSKLGPMLASGRPVVVAADPGSELERWIGDAAIVAPANDPAALASALERALVEGNGHRIARAQALARSLDACVILPAFQACLMTPGSRSAAHRDIGPVLTDAPLAGTPRS